MDKETGLKMGRVLETVGVILISAVLILLAINMLQEPPKTEYITTPPTLNPREHEISRVEDLFIPFKYEDGDNHSFTMTENFTTLNIVLQPNREGETTIYEHSVEITNTTKGRTTRINEQTTIEFEGFVYGGTYTLYFDGGRGVATAT